MYTKLVANNFSLLRYSKIFHNAMVNKKNLLLLFDYIYNLLNQNCPITVWLPMVVMTLGMPSD